MRLPHFCRTLCLLAALLPALSGASTAAEGKNSNTIVLTLPAETVLATVRQVLPLDIPSQSRQVQGDITLESLDRLVIHNDIISVHGVLAGRNLVVITNLAGQDIQLRLGELRLPLSCDLKTRFDPVRRKLFVTPRCTDPVSNGGPDNPAAPLLGALGGKEYQVELDALQLLKIKLGTRTIPLALEPVKISGADNALIFHLHPQAGVGK